MNFQRLFPKLIFFTIAILVLSISSCEKKKKAIAPSIYAPHQIDNYYQLANKYYDNQLYDSAFYYGNKIRLKINPSKYLQKYTINMFILVTCQQLQGDYTGAENSIVETLNALDTLKSDKYNFKFYSMLGTNYIFLHQYENALNCYKKTLNYKINNARKINSFLNIACIYIKQKKISKALDILKQLLKKNKNKNYQSIILNEYGYCLHKLGNQNAIKYLKLSLDLRLNMDTSADDDYYLTSNYLYLYEYYANKNKPKAYKYAKLLYQKATEYKNPDDCLIALTLLTKCTEGQESKKYALKYISLNDSITEIRQKAKNYFAKLKYDSKKEKEENRKLKAEKELQAEQERNKNILISLILIMLLIITFFIFYYLTEKNKKEKLQTAYNTETRIAKKLHDELANDIYQTINFAETQDLSSAANSEKLLENLDTIYATTRNLSRENSPIETGLFFKDNLIEMITSFKSNAVNIIINGLEDIAWTNLNSLKKITIYRIIQELLVNMKKHSESNLVIVSFKLLDNNLLINYFDNGIGFDLEKKLLKNGIQNIENRINGINGNFTVHSKPNKGVKINISIPV